MTTTDVSNRPTAADGHLLVDRLVADGLPEPARRKVRDDLGELTLSLTVATEADWSTWRERLDTVGTIDPGPWRVGPVSAQVAVGRIHGVSTVLALEVEHATDRAARPSPTPRTNIGGAPCPPGSAAEPPAADVLVAPPAGEERAESPPAPDQAATGPAPEVDAETTGDHDFRDYLGPDGRPRPVPVDVDEEQS